MIRGGVWGRWYLVPGVDVFMSVVIIMDVLNNHCSYYYVRFTYRLLTQQDLFVKK